MVSIRWPCRSASGVASGVCKGPEKRIDARPFSGVSAPVNGAEAFAPAVVAGAVDGEDEDEDEDGDGDDEDEEGEAEAAAAAPAGDGVLANGPLARTPALACARSAAAAWTAFAVAAARPDTKAEAALNGCDEPDATAGGADVDWDAEAEGEPVVDGDEDAVLAAAGGAAVGGTAWRLMMSAKVWGVGAWAVSSPAAAAFDARARRRAPKGGIWPASPAATPVVAEAFPVGSADGLAIRARRGEAADMRADGLSGVVGRASCARRFRPEASNRRAKVQLVDFIDFIESGRAPSQPRRG